MKNKCIIIVCIVVFIFLLISNCYCISAQSVDHIYDPITTGNNPLAAPAKLILGIIKYVGVAICVGAIIVNGIKYVTVSPEGKAEIKKQIIMFVIGAILLFSVTTFIDIIYDLTQESGLNKINDNFLK